MRKTLTAVALTAALTGGSTAAVATLAGPAQAAPPVTNSSESGNPSGGQEAKDGKESDKTGLWGLLGLLGLAGLAKRKEHTETHTTSGSAHR